MDCWFTVRTSPCTCVYLPVRLQARGNRESLRFLLHLPDLASACFSSLILPTRSLFTICWTTRHNMWWLWHFRQGAFYLAHAQCGWECRPHCSQALFNITSSMKLKVILEIFKSHNSHSEHFIEHNNMPGTVPDSGDLSIQNKKSSSILLKEMDNKLCKLHTVKRL